MKKTLFAIVFTVAALAIFVGFGQLVDVSAQDGKQTVNVVSSISDEWKGSGKVFVLDSFATQYTDPEVELRVACSKCHDGYGAANFKYNSANVGAYAPAHQTGISCIACHSGDVREVMDSGVASVPFMQEDIVAGTSASCIHCHNSNRNPADLYAQSSSGEMTRLTYPHYGMQAALWSGKGGMVFEGANFKTSPTHAQVGCVDCHMPKSEAGYATHGFAMDLDYMDETCGTCHIGITSYDYNNVQTEIKAMLAEVLAEVLALSGAAELDAGGGQFIFKDANGETMTHAQVGHKAYVGAYNWRMVYKDGSYGVHNPAYAKSLLEETLAYMRAE